MIKVTISYDHKTVRVTITIKKAAHKVGKWAAAIMKPVQSINDFS